MNNDTADRLERERYARVVREFHAAFDRDYLDLKAIADAELRTQDEHEGRESA